MSVSDHTTPVEYRDIPGFPGYQAGSDGSIRCLHNTRRVPCEPRYLRGSITRKGYVRVVIHSRPGCHAGKLVHNLVLAAFVGPRPEGMECCHWDGDKRNNRLGNLRWDTPKGNAADTLRLGRRKSLAGDENPNAKLGRADVVTIKRLIREGRTNPEIAALFGVTPLVISKIRTGRTWSHVA